MCPRPGTILNMTATRSLALPSAVSVAPRTQSQRSQRPASLGRRCPQYGHGILSPVGGSGWATGASVYSTFTLTESHKSHRIRQANRIQNNRRRSPRADGSEEGTPRKRSKFVRQRPWKRKAATDYVTRRHFSKFETLRRSLLFIHHHSSRRLSQFQLGAHLLNLRGLVFYCCHETRDRGFQFRDPLLLLLKFIERRLGLGTLGSA